MQQRIYVFVFVIFLSCNGIADEDLKPKVLIETTHGSILLELNREKAPITVENFLKLVDEKFYDGLIFHRVIKGFMIQGGGFDEHLVDRSSPDNIQSEAQNGLSNVKGTIAMARRQDPHSASSQFYINTVDNSRGLDYPSNGGYTVFGNVIEGIEAVLSIENVETQNNVTAASGVTLHDVPVATVSIVSAKRMVEDSAEQND